MKKYLSSSPLLSPSKPGEELYLYIAVSQATVSTALVREEEGSQRFVYFISMAFRGAEERYPQMEKLAFALVTAVLPGPYHHSFDGSAPENSHEKP